MTTEIIIVIVSVFVIWTTYTTWGVFIWEILLILAGYGRVKSVASMFEDAWLQEKKKPTKYQRFLMDHECFVKGFVRYFALMFLFALIISSINSDTSNMAVYIKTGLIFILPFIVAIKITKRTNLHIPTRKYKWQK